VERTCSPLGIQSPDQPISRKAMETLLRF